MMPKLFFNKSPLSTPTFSAVWKGSLVSGAMSSKPQLN